MNHEPAGRVETHEGKEHRQDCLCHYEGESAQAGMPVPLLAGKWRLELAGGEVIEGAEAAAELVGAQAAVAVERAYKLDGGALRFIGVTVQTARDEVAEGIAPELGLRDDMVEAPSLGNEPAQTIEAAAALAGVDGAAERTRLQEIGLRESAT